MDSNHDIGKLFSNKLKNYQVAGSEADWQKISSKLGRANFVKFSLVTFNIYYLSAILIFAGSATYSGVKNFALTHKVQKLEKSIEAYQKTGILPVTEESSIDTTEFVEPEAPDHIESSAIPSIDLKQISEPLTKGRQEKKKIPSDTISAPKVDTVITTTSKVVLSDSFKVEKRIKKVKKTVYVKPDDIVKRDTVIISKPKK